MSDDKDGSAFHQFIHTFLDQELLTLPELLKQTLKLENEVKKVAAKVYKSPSFIFIARNASFPLALEGALKLKEISYFSSDADGIICSFDQFAFSK